MLTNLESRSNLLMVKINNSMYIVWLHGMSGVHVILQIKKHIQILMWYYIHNELRSLKLSKLSIQFLYGKINFQITINKLSRKEDVWEMDTNKYNYSNGIFMQKFAISFSFFHSSIKAKNIDINAYNCKIIILLLL